MSYQEALERIKEAEEKNLIELDLMFFDLKEIPKEVFELTNLQRLYLSDNQISQIPKEIENLANLQILSLYNNQISQIPKEIENLANLQILSLYNNQIKEIPKEIEKLANLQRLDLSSNQISQIPKEIEKLANLQILSLYNNQISQIPKEIEKLANLQRLDLSNNQISQIPKEIEKLTNLTELDLSNNQISQIPKEIEKLANLQRLDLDNNQISQIPKEIEKLANLQILYLYSNQIKGIPKEIEKLTNLTELYLSDNQISQIPKEIEKLSNLKKLDLNNNQIKNIPDEVYKKSAKEVIEYILKKQSSYKRKLNEAKVLFVGEGGVGKTSLINRILYNTFNQAESKTDGIEIKKFKFEYESEEIKLNIWDFGGQEIMHSTHQFFLTNRSLYVLVWDARQEDRYGLVEYWLELIKSFGGESPILVVMNKVDEHSASIDKEFLSEKYPNIRGFYNTSCKKNFMIDELIEDIKKNSLSLSHIRDELPVDWFNIKDKLEELKKQNIDFIHYDEYKKFCEEEKITKPSERKLLISLLHDLGIILNFRDEPRLKDVGIINPLWVTEGVYKILNSEILINDKGILNLRDLEIILKEHRDKYPNSKDMLLVDMMIKFELCFEIDRNSFLVAEALPKETPKLNWNKKESLSFEYHYNFLPQSIISRFIVKSHKMIDDFFMWRSGVILQKDGIKALIQADRKDKKIFIYINSFGINARIFLAIIRDKFREIHNSIKTIEPKEKIPLYDNHKVVVDYEYLIFLESQNIREYFFEGANRKYNISKLLNNIETKEERYMKREIHLHNGDYYEKTKQNVKNGSGSIGGKNITHTVYNDELNTKLLELIESIKESEIKDRDEIIESLQNAKDENSLKTTLLNLMQRGAEVGSILSGIAGVMGIIK